MRYREYADQIRATGATVSNDNAITFVLPMPASWSNKKKLEYLNTYHYQKPDIDNLLKALLDACHKDDSHIAHLSSVKKIWGYQGAIIIGEDNDQ